MPPTFPWPELWLHNEDHIRCIIPSCGFVTSTDSLNLQWIQMRDHCNNISGAEHGLLEIMLRQSICAKCPFNIHGGEVSHKIRKLYTHEKNVHGSSEMFNLCSFVRLAREGRIRKGQAGGGQSLPEPECERLACIRMVEKVWALPHTTIGLLFQKSGYAPNQMNSENLAKILTKDISAQSGESPPYWWPVRAEAFLDCCAPHPTDPADDVWRTIWTELRAKYADGRI